MSQCPSLEIQSRLRQFSFVICERQLSLQIFQFSFGSDSLVSLFVRIGLRLWSLLRQFVFVVVLAGDAGKQPAIYQIQNLPKRCRKDTARKEISLELL